MTKRNKKKKIGIKIMFYYDPSNKRWWLDVNDLLLFLSENKFTGAKNQVLKKFRDAQGSVDVEAWLLKYEEKKD